MVFPAEKRRTVCDECSHSLMICYACRDVVYCSEEKEGPEPMMSQLESFDESATAQKDNLTKEPPCSVERPPVPSSDIDRLVECAPRPMPRSAMKSRSQFAEVSPAIRRLVGSWTVICHPAHGKQLRSLVFYELIVFLVDYSQLTDAPLFRTRSCPPRTPS